MKGIIYCNKDFWKAIQDANTPKKAKELARAIKQECDNYRHINYYNGSLEGRKEVRKELRSLLMLED